MKHRTKISLTGLVAFLVLWFVIAQNYTREADLLSAFSDEVGHVGETIKSPDWNWGIIAFNFENVRDIPPSELTKIQYSGFSAILKAIAHITGNLLEAYLALADFIPVRYRKSDIIFPFQYFW